MREQMPMTGGQWALWVIAAICVVAATAVEILFLSASSVGVGHYRGTVVLTTTVAFVSHFFQGR
jgi:hypothetical protein